MSLTHCNPDANTDFFAVGCALVRAHAGSRTPVSLSAASEAVTRARLAACRAVEKRVGDHAVGVCANAADAAIIELAEYLLELASASDRIEDVCADLREILVVVQR